MIRKLLSQPELPTRGTFASAADAGQGGTDFRPSLNQGDSSRDEKISKTMIKMLRPEDVWHPKRGAPNGNQNAVTHGRQTAELRVMRAEVWQAIRRGGALIGLAKAHLAAQRRSLSFDAAAIPEGLTNSGNPSVTGLRDIRHTSGKSLANQELPLDRLRESDKVNQSSDVPAGELPSGGGMIKSELVARLSQRYPHLYHRDVERIVTTVLDEISKALAHGHRVELRGFGAFSVKVRPSRVGRNPRTGEAVQVAAKKAPFFRTGKELRERLNAMAGAPAPKQPADSHVGT